MDPPCALRPARPDDRQALARLYVQSAELAAGRDPAVYVVPDPLEVAGRLAARPASEDRLELVAEDGDGQVVGYLRAELHQTPAGGMLRPRRSGWVRDLVVTAGHRGRGIGRRLLEAGEAWVRARGGEDMLVDTDAGNTGALRFYTERMGYRPLGVVLGKPLRPAEPQGDRRSRRQPPSGPRV